METRPTLEAFDRYLSQQGLSLEGVVIGGAALNLLGISHRVTRDCDLISPQLTDAFLRHARLFAHTRREAGEDLQDNWLNNGPISIVDQLPTGWRDRLRVVFQGESLVLSTLDRLDLLRTKLFALCDRALDLPDCLALSPTKEELVTIQTWLEEQDGHPGWPDHVRETLGDLSRRLGHGV